MGASLAVLAIVTLTPLGAFAQPAPAEPPPPDPAPSAAPAPAEPPPIDVDAAPPPADASAGDAAPPEDEPIDVDVHARRNPPSRGASTFDIHPENLAKVPRPSAAKFLTLAPGFFLTNEGGLGHAERIYLRGFDAREGQDIELSVGGMPINEAGNHHGNGFADTGFIMPELISSIHVLEGPFDPRQGNFAVAGSVDYQLGLAQRGLTTKISYGSFNTARLAVTYGPPGMSEGTFAGAEILTTDGFGENRDARRASTMAQYEGALGKDGSFRILGTAYVTDYHSAGTLREDDVEDGREDFYGTYDTRQGGNAHRFGLSADLQTKVDKTVLSQQLFVSKSKLGIRSNLTGFLLDVQEATQSLHGQRGDLFDLDNDTITYGGRGSARFEAPWLEGKQAIELGYFARGDHVSSLQQRIQAGTDAPYRKEADFVSNLGDIGVFVDAQFQPIKWITLRGGLRGDLFAFDVRDNCAIKSVSLPAGDRPLGDASCFDQTRGGDHREPDQRSTTASVKLMPRGTLILGPFEGFSFSASAGIGARSIDPSYITQDTETPFASIDAYEGGVSYARSTDDVSIEAKSIFFATHVDRDQIFSETEGRQVIGGGTTRTGWVGSARIKGDFFDTSNSVTLVKSAFDDDGLLVPYVPDVVVRSDGALFGELPIPSLLGSGFRGHVGLGASVIGRRALPFGQRSDAIFTLDAETGVEWNQLALTFAMENILGTEYRVAEYNYVSDFRSRPAATLVPARHFVAGAPRSFTLSLAYTLGGT